MCDKKTNSIVHAQQAPVELVAEFMMTAEKELAAFYEAVFRRYGLTEARKDHLRKFQVVTGTSMTTRRPRNFGHLSISSAARTLLPAVRACSISS
jgi:hypothetical protein